MNKYLFLMIILMGRFAFSATVVSCEISGEQSAATNNYIMDVAYSNTYAYDQKTCDSIFTIHDHVKILNVSLGVGTAVCAFVPGGQLVSATLGLITAGFIVVDYKIDQFAEECAKSKSEEDARRLAREAAKEALVEYLIRNNVKVE